jgi:CRP-like cAMP-binding protein
MCGSEQIAAPRTHTLGGDAPPKHNAVRSASGDIAASPRPSVTSTSPLKPGPDELAIVKRLPTPSRALTHNLLLGALPVEVLDRLLPHLEPVSMPLGKVIYESGVELKHVYFPTSGCIVSMLYVMRDGASAEIAVVGDEGVVGIALFMGGDTTPSRALVQSAGHAFRLGARALRQEFSLQSDLHVLLLRYTQALITQMSQTAVCNRHHSLEQQLCRWLLLSQDRLPTNQLTMTQELIANMLGVRREGVTAAAGKLQAAGLIRYSRGRITIVDRQGLEALVCECYAVVKTEYDRLLAPNPSRRGHQVAGSG